MKLLVISINCAPELTGIGKYVGEMVEWLVAHGAEVRVVTAPPYYPAWRVAHGYSAWRYRSERLGGALVYRCPLYVPRRLTGLRRLVHLLSFALTSLPVCLGLALRWRPDVVFVVEPPLVCAPAAWCAARLAGARSWLHVQDFEVDAAFGLGLLRSAWLRRVATAAEVGLLRLFDRVSAISEPMVDRLASKRVPPASRYLFPNWVDTAEIHPLACAGTLRGDLGLPDGPLVFLYSGNLGQKQGLEVLIEAAHALEADRRVLFLICGEGPARTPLEHLAAGAPNIVFRDLQPRERLNELLNLAAVHLLPQRAGVEDLVLPSKLTAMMASGRPVLATARPGTGLARAVEHGGLVVAPGDAAALATAASRLAADPSLRTALGASGREFARREWDKEAILSRAFDAEAPRPR